MLLKGVFLIGLFGTTLGESALGLNNRDSSDIWNWVDRGLMKDTDSSTDDPLALSIKPGLSSECLHHLHSTVSMTTGSNNPYPLHFRELCRHVTQCYVCGIMSVQLKNLFDTVLGCSERQHYKRAPWAGAERRYDALLQVLGSKISSGKKRSENEDWERYDSDTMSPYSTANELEKNEGGFIEAMKSVGNVNKRQAEAVGDGGLYPIGENTLGAFASDLALQTYAALLNQDYRQIRGDNHGGRRTRPFVG